MTINWGIGLNAPDAGQAFSAGWRQGGTENALRRISANPGDSGAINALMNFDPRMGMHFQEQQRAQQAATQERDIKMRAAQGDPEARTQLAGIDWKAWEGLEDGAKKQASQAVDFIAQAAMHIDSLPEQDRAAAWAGYVQNAEARGMDIPPLYETYSPAVLQAAIAEAGEIKGMLEARQPKYQVVPEGGALVNTRDTAALSQFGAGTSQGQPAQPGAQPAPQAVQQAEDMFAQVMQTKIATPEQVAIIRNGFGSGPDSERRVQSMLRESGIQVGRQIGGKMYVQRGADWYEVN